jgi:hypothetical protein
VRVPSYEGSGWDDEISLTKLHTVREGATDKSQRIQPAKPATRVPVPIKPAPYSGDLRVGVKDSHLRGIPKPLPWPGTSPPKATAWPAMDELIPSVPSEGSVRQNSTRDYVSGFRPQQLVRDESDRNIARIVSKENIRSVLRHNSLNSSAEDLTQPPPVSFLPGHNRTASPGGTRLQTYNANLFPRREERKGTPVGGRVGTEKKRDAPGGSYEMDDFSRATDGQGVQNKTAGSDTRYHERYHGMRAPGDRCSFEKWI